MGNGNFVLQGHATADIARIITRSRPEVSEERIYLFPQQGAKGAYRAFRTRADDSGRITGVDYVDALSRIVQPLGTFGSVRLSVASSGSSFACINEGGRGFIYDSTMCGIMPIRGVPEVAGPAALIGFEKHYEEFDTRAPAFVVACLDGSLWWLPFHGKAQSMGKVPLEQISRAVLLRHENHLVWHGISIHHGKEGPEDTYSLMYLGLERERGEFRGMHFTAEDGRLNAGVFDPVTGDLILFWSGHATLDSYIMRSPPTKLVQGVATREPLPHAAGAICAAHALPGTRLCVVEDIAGTSTLIDLATLRVLGALPRSHHASSMAPAPNGQVLLADQTGGLSLATWTSQIPTP
jgi:hypothetical protein